MTREKDARVGVWCWHIHHDRLLELSIEPLAVRAEFIRTHKPLGEVDVRLERMHPVRGELPKAFKEAKEKTRGVGERVRRAKEARDKATEACKEGWETWEARETWKRAWRAWNRTWEAWDKTLGNDWKAIEKLHALECPGCPWDGETLFPREEEEQLL